MFQENATAAHLIPLNELKVKNWAQVARRVLCSHARVFLLQLPLSPFPFISTKFSFLRFIFRFVRGLIVRYRCIIIVKFFSIDCALGEKNMATRWNDMYCWWPHYYQLRAMLFKTIAWMSNESLAARLLWVICPCSLAIAYLFYLETELLPRG